jgi:hypothetical protein
MLKTRKILGRALLVGSLAMLSGTVAAQRKTATSGMATPRHEIGADFEASYTKISGAGGGLILGLPVDVRVALLTHKKLMWEPRLSFAVSTIGTTTYVIAPGLNVLYQRTRGTGPYGLLRAPYLTGGVALNLFDFGLGSGTQLALNGGVGKRIPFEGDAARFEGFIGYEFKGGGEPSRFAIGIRIGLSFWH